MTQIEKKIKIGGKIKIGILDGFVKDSKNEVVCPNIFNAGKFQSADLEKYFTSITKNGQAKYEISRLNISQINNKYAVLINPFGEAYPENDLQDYNSFRIIENYIIDGGIFVGFGGLLFFYGWDVNHVEKDISTNKVILPVYLTAGELNVQDILDFSGTLSWKEFGIQTTFDTLVNSGPALVKVSQSQTDRDIAGDSVNLGGSDLVHDIGP